MDFAYVPAPESKDDLGTIGAAEMLALRIGPSGLIPKAFNSLKEMLNHADTTATGGIGQIFIVSHASPTHVSFPITAAQTRPSVYEVLVDTPKPALPPIYRTPPAQGASPVRIIIKGCRLGRSEAFMRVFKSLIGEGATVTAPKHFNYFLTLRNKTSRYIFDSLGYDCEIHRKDPITTHKALRTAFTSQTFDRYDGTPVPAKELTSLIDQLLPKKVEKYLPTRTTKTEIRIPLYGKIKLKEEVLGDKVHGTKAPQYRAHFVSKTIRQMPLADFKAKPLADHVTDAQTEWEAKYKSVNVLGGTVKKSFAESLGLHAGEDIATFVKIVSEQAGPKGARIVNIKATHFRYELIFPIASVTDGTMFYESIAVRGPPMINTVYWPSVPSEFDALFRTV